MCIYIYVYIHVYIYIHIRTYAYTCVFFLGRGILIRQATATPRSAASLAGLGLSELEARRGSPKEGASVGRLFKEIQIGLLEKGYRYRYGGRCR